MVICIRSMKVKISMHFGHKQRDVWLKLEGVVLTTRPEMRLKSTNPGFLTYPCWGSCSSFTKESLLGHHTLGSQESATTFCMKSIALSILNKPRNYPEHAYQTVTPAQLVLHDKSKCHCTELKERISKICTSMHLSTFVLKLFVPQAQKSDFRKTKVKDVTW